MQHLTDHLGPIILGLTSAEKNELVRFLLTKPAWRAKSDRKFAKDLFGAVSREFVRKLRSSTKAPKLSAKADKLAQSLALQGVAVEKRIVEEDGSIRLVCQLDL